MFWRAALIVMTLLVVSCGHQSPRQKFFADHGPLDNQVSLLEAKRAKIMAIIRQERQAGRTPPYDRLFNLRAPLSVARAATEKAMVQLDPQRIPKECQDFLEAYYGYLEEEREYYKAIDQMVEAVQAGGSNPDLARLERDDQSLQQQAAKLAADLQAIQRMMTTSEPGS